MFLNVGNFLIYFMPWQGKWVVLDYVPFDEIADYILGYDEDRELDILLQKIDLYLDYGIY